MDKHGRIIIASCVLFLGLTPISNDYSKKESIEMEFKNIYGQAQDKQFTIASATPTLTALQDGEMVIFRTGDLSGLMYRSGNEIFKVNASCVTVTR